VTCTESASNRERAARPGPDARRSPAPESVVALG
jgi:hypothetical protein